MISDDIENVQAFLSQPLKFIKRLRSEGKAEHDNLLEKSDTGLPEESMLGITWSTVNDTIRPNSRLALTCFKRRKELGWPVYLDELSDEIIMSQTFKAQLTRRVLSSISLHFFDHVGTFGSLVIGSFKRLKEIINRSSN